MKDTRKSVKRSLATSAAALGLSVAMLVGTTFAWFTDSVTSGKNKIQAGNLDIRVEYAKLDETGAVTGWGDLTKDTSSLFSAGLWEPGHTEYALLRISNEGSLALKYKAKVTVEDETPSTNVYDDEFKLSEHLYYGTEFADTQPTVTRTSAEDMAKTLVGTTTLDEKHLAAKSDPVVYDYLTIAVTMPKDVGNVANHKSTADAPSVDLGITVVATQDTVERDSFDNTYDQGASDDILKESVSVTGLAGMADSYDSIQDAYEAGKKILTDACGLREESLSADAFNALFTDGGKITWTIYGEQKVTDSRMFSFGRAANRFGSGLQISEIDIVGGNSTAALDLSSVNSTFALPYNWWNVEGSYNTTLNCKNVAFNGITSMPSGTYQCTLYPTTYIFDGCTFNGNVYSYQNFNVDMTIKNCTFNAPAATQYAFMSQGAGGTITLKDNIFNNYTRGINLQRATAEFVVTGNTIKSNCSEPDRAAIQITDGKSFVVNDNKVDVNAGNAFWFHNAATNSDVTYTINNNDIKAPYIGYSGVSAFDVNTKITSSGNTFNNTDTTKCMKKEQTVAESTNLTAIQ